VKPKREKLLQPNQKTKSYNFLNQFIMKTTMTSETRNEIFLLNKQTIQMESQAPIIESIIETIIEPIIFKC
jgi:hypothetical protein